VKGLLEQRRASGGWYTTQDNLYALSALTNHAQARAGRCAAVKASRATVPNNLPRDDPDWYGRLWLTQRELGDERVDAFMDWLAPHPGAFEYLARATTVGVFQVPAATARKMYDPDVNGRTALRRFEVVARR